MSNASRSLSRAARYARLAERAENLEARRAARALATIWQEIAALADDFDRRTDPVAKQRIYDLVDTVGEARRKVA